MTQEKELFTEELKDELSKLVSLLPPIQVKMPRFHYWQIKKDHYAFCYTTEPIKGKFYAMVYRITKVSWKLTRKVAFARRKIAKARAYNWYCQRKEQERLKRNEKN